MSSTRIEINLNQIALNADNLIKTYETRGIEITAVTKGVCGAPAVAATLVRAGIRSLGESRLENIRRMRDAGVQAQFMLIRPPRASEVARVVRLADVSLNSEPSVVRLLAEHARALGKTHGIILMVEMGDLREGILPCHLDDVIEQILPLRSVRLVGLGTNLACLNGVVPTDAKMSELSVLAERVEARHDLALEIVSGGNSANHDWVASAEDVGRINHLRIGEALLLGRETVNRKPIPGLATDAVTLVGEVIEVKTKPSRPYGEVGLDALGREPVFSDKGPMRRVIVALGEQDIDQNAIRPQVQAEIIGACSDQLVLHDRSGSLQVGSRVSFDLGYAALLRAMTSPYIEKVYKPPIREDRQNARHPSARHRSRFGLARPWVSNGPARWSPQSSASRPTTNLDANVHDAS